jgi:hypothetical protein
VQREVPWAARAGPEPDAAPAVPKGAAQSAGCPEHLPVEAGGSLPRMARLAQVDGVSGHRMDSLGLGPEPGLVLQPHLLLMVVRVDSVGFWTPTSPGAGAIFELTGQAFARVQLLLPTDSCRGGHGATIARSWVASCGSCTPAGRGGCAQSVSAWQTCNSRLRRWQRGRDSRSVQVRTPQAGSRQRQMHCATTAPPAGPRSAGHAPAPRGGRAGWPARRPCSQPRNRRRAFELDAAWYSPKQVA